MKAYSYQEMLYVYLIIYILIIVQCLWEGQVIQMKSSIWPVVITQWKFKNSPARPVVALAIQRATDKAINLSIQEVIMSVWLYSNDEFLTSGRLADALKLSSAAMHIHLPILLFLKGCLFKWSLLTSCSTLMWKVSHLSNCDGRPFSRETQKLESIQNMRVVTA